jgi:hypothetical protein
MRATCGLTRAAMLGLRCRMGLWPLEAGCEGSGSWTCCLGGGVRWRTGG